MKTLNSGDISIRRCDEVMSLCMYENFRLDPDCFYIVK